MADINVTYQTQKIIVDPSTNSISVVQAGPQGPGGPTGEVSTAQLNTALADKVDVAGDTMTGALVLPVNTAALQAARISAYNNITGQLRIAGAVEFGDTGWRDISTLMSSRFTTKTHAKIRRTADLVHYIFQMQVDGSTLTAGTNWLAAAGNIPDGFRPDYTLRSIVANSATGAVITTLYYSTAVHALGASGNISAGTTVLVDHTFTTSNNWPSSLPGSQGTAPFSL